MVKAIPTPLDGVFVIEYETNEDNRSMFSKILSNAELESIGITTPFVETYLYSNIKRNTIYGIHFQNKPHLQAKIVHCVKGRIKDYAVDLRKASPNYMKWFGIELSESNRKQLYIPEGFGHLSHALQDDTSICMSISVPFDREFSRSISYRDASIALDIPDVDYILSDQDVHAPSLLCCDMDI